MGMISTSRKARSMPICTAPRVAPPGITNAVERAAVATGPWDVAANGLSTLQYTDQGRPLEAGEPARTNRPFG